jgi:hypothetical protein
MIRTRVGKINNNNGIYLIFACVIFSIFLSIRQMHLGTITKWPMLQ